MPTLRPTTNSYRPCMLLATGAHAQPPDVWMRLRRMGWDIYPAKSGPEAIRLARMLEPDLVVMDTDLMGESGWLTCAGLKQQRPDGEVILLGDDEGPDSRRHAEHVGADAILARDQNIVPALHPRRCQVEQVVEAA